MKKYKINFYCTTVAEKDKTEAQLSIIEKCINITKGKLCTPELLADVVIELDINKIKVRSICFVDRTIFLYIK